jgi:hypothetical protein
MAGTTHRVPLSKIIRRSLKGQVHLFLGDGSWGEDVFLERPHEVKEAESGDDYQFRPQNCVYRGEQVLIPRDTTKLQRKL